VNPSAGRWISTRFATNLEGAHQKAQTSTKEHIMSTHNHKKAITTALGVAAAAVGAPAILFAGAGSAQAQSTVSTSTNAFGVTVHIKSWGAAANKSGGACTYTAIPDPSTTDPGYLPPLPVYAVPFHMTPGGAHDMWFPGIQTGTDWTVTVNCTEGVNSLSEHEIY
jgi:hypothetical protein